MRRLAGLAGCMLPLVLGCATPRSSAEPDDEDAALARIAAWEDGRTLADGALVRWARESPRASVRARALLALGRFQALEASAAVADALGDPEPRVRAMAAFAAGLLGLAWEPVPEPVRVQLATAVLIAEARESDPAARLAELEALGRLPTPPALDRLVERVGGTGEVATRAALSLGVAARAKARLPDAAGPALVDRLAGGRGARTPAERWAAAYALGAGKLAAGREGLRGALADAAADVRAIAAKGLFDLGTPADAEVLRPLLLDPDPRAAAEATRTLARWARACSGACPPLDVLGALSRRVDALARGQLSAGAPPLLALAQAGLPEAGRPLLATLRDGLRAAFGEAPPDLRPDLAGLDCRLAAAMDAQRGALEETLACGAGLVAAPRRLRLGLEAVAGSEAVPLALDAGVLRPFLRGPTPSVQAAAVAVLGASRRPEVAPALRPLVEDRDPVLAAAAVAALGALGDRGALPAMLGRAGRVLEMPESASSFVDAFVALRALEAVPLLERWLTLSHQHVRQEAARGLTALQSRPVRARWVDGATPVPAAPPAMAGGLWRLRTARGLVTLRPDPEAAPRTVAQLDRLAREGFYRNLTFHRVVPDFVVQGGDPRGDGEGGPGFTLRCEVSPRHYLRGTVGMALSGKDTGGSQFFVALSPQPHLDGRYPIVGDVVSGMEVLDALQEGDALGDLTVVP